MTGAGALPDGFILSEGLARRLPEGLRGSGRPALRGGLAEGFGNIAALTGGNVLSEGRSGAFSEGLSGGPGDVLAEGLVHALSLTEPGVSSKGQGFVHSGGFSE